MADTHHARRMKLRDIAPGQLVLREGDPPGPIYVIRGGHMRVFRGDQSHDSADVALLSTGDLIGEVGAILVRPRSASVQALET